jgi:alkyl hydroperoxide reductase subunit F
VYAARKKLKGLLLTDSFGGQSVASGEIQNFIGFKSISGLNLAKALKEHLQVQAGIKIIEGDLVVEINPSTTLRIKGFKITTRKGKIFNTKTILLAGGGRQKKLNVPGEKEFAGRGVFYCAICDAPLMKNKAVAVIGGGNAGLEAVRDLLLYASEIYLLEYTAGLTADPVMIEVIKKSKKIKIITLAEVREIFGDEFVRGLKYRDRRDGKIKKLNLQGIFIAVGYQPNSEIAKDLVKRNKLGYIVVNSQTQKTSCPGIWASGDVTDGLYHQNNIAIGDAIKAVLNIYQYLLK